ncbi:MAG TPA: hypothetical protein GX509_10105 [Firmicutes bacterium]|nr:hypothetical protein [Bacillota bacterium]
MKSVRGNEVEIRQKRAERGAKAHPCRRMVKLAAQRLKVGVPDIAGFDEEPEVQ